MNRKHLNHIDPDATQIDYQNQSCLDILTFTIKTFKHTNKQNKTKESPPNKQTKNFICLYALCLEKVGSGREYRERAKKMNHENNNSDSCSGGGGSSSSSSSSSSSGSSSSSNDLNHIDPDATQMDYQNQSCLDILTFTIKTFKHTNKQNKTKESPPPTNKQKNLICLYPLCLEKVGSGREYRERAKKMNHENNNSDSCSGGGGSSSSSSSGSSSSSNDSNDDDEDDDDDNKVYKV